MMLELSRLNGDRAVLADARVRLAGAQAAVTAAITELEQVADIVAARMPAVDMYFDLSELRGYHYHTGLVFAALAPGYGQALANGGRYDHIGEVFGRARPATGFNCDLKALLKAMPVDPLKNSPAIFAPAQNDVALWQSVQVLRAQGERVINGLSGQVSAVGCDRQLVLEGGQWLVKPI